MNAIDVKSDHQQQSDARNRYVTLMLFRGVILLSIIVCLAMSFIVGNGERDAMVGVLGTLCLLIVSLPLFLRSDYSLFEPLTFIILLVLFGTPMKLLYVIAYRAQDIYVAKRLLNWELPEALLPALMVVMCGWVCFVIGYGIRLPRSPIGHFYMPSCNNWNRTTLKILMVIVAVISLACLAAFIVSAGVGFGSLKELSSKRFSEEAGSAANRMHQVKYYLYRGAAISKFLVYFGLVELLGRRQRLASWTGVVVVLALLQTVFLSFVINNRAGVLLILIDCMVIYYYMRKVISYKIVLWAFAVASLLLVPMLAGRAKNESTVSLLLQKTLAGRDMLDITKTCHIIKGVPQKMDYLRGETLYGWLATPIPRSMWEDKPMWAEKGPFINQKIFGDRTGISGVPPGLVAEFYWNFGFLGVCGGLFFTGLLLRHLFLAFMQYSDRPSSVLIYTLLVTRFGMFSFGNDFGTGIIKTALDLVPVMAILWLVGGSWSAFGASSRTNAARTVVPPMSKRSDKSELIVE